MDWVLAPSRTFLSARERPLEALLSLGIIFDGTAEAPTPVQKWNRNLDVEENAKSLTNRKGLFISRGNRLTVS